MAHIREVMAMGVASPLARMLGSNRQMTVLAGGSSQDDATPLIVNYALIQSPAPGAGVRLGPASGAAVTALYNSGPVPVNLYPAEDDAFNDQAPDLPLALAAGQTALAVPSIDRWIVSLQGAGSSGGGITEAPSDGNWYGRRNASWSPVLGLAGGTLGGPLILADDPATTLGAATKGYVDSAAALLAPLATPAFTGAPTAPTPALADNSTRLATTAYVQAQGYGDISGVAAGAGLVGGGASGSVTLSLATLIQQALAISTNAAAILPAPAAGAVLQLAGPDGAGVTRLELDNYGGSGGNLSFRAAAGTAGAPAALASGAQIGAMTGLGYDGSAYSLNQGGLTFYAAQPWTPTAHGTRLSFNVTPNGSLTPLSAVILENDGGLLLPGIVAGGSKGSGAVNVSGGYYVGGNSIYASPSLTGAPTAPTPAMADNSTALATTAFVKGQNYLAAPVSLTAQVSGILPVPNGGTGLAGGTSGGIPYYSAAGAMASSAALAAAALVLGGGVGAAPQASAVWTAGSALIGNNNPAAAPAFPIGGFQIVGNDANQISFQGDAFGVGLTNFAGRLAGGTNAAKSAVASGATITRFSAGGYDGTAYQTNAARIDFLADETWSSTARGTRIMFFTTHDTTISGVGNMTVANDGGLLLPNAVVGASKGPGAINVSAGYYVGGVNVTPGQSAASQTASANPAGTTQTTARMMGLAGAITPLFTGRIWLTMTGDVFNATAGDGATIQLSYGTGTAPANGAAAAGTQIGARVNYIAGSTAEKVPFSLTAFVTGLVANTAYWLDAAVAAITGGTATIENVVISAREF